MNGVKILYPVQTNQVFAVTAEKLIQATIDKYRFYVRDKKLNKIRFVTSFDTTENEVNDFLRICKESSS